MSAKPYDWLARDYDPLFAAYRGPMDEAREKLLGRILPAVESACDLACGTGTTAVGLARRGIRMYGVDLSPVMCRLARAKARKAGVAVRVSRADMLDFRLPDEGVAGDNIGVLLRGTDREEIERGMVLAKPGSITPHTKFKGEVYVLTKEEGGRHTPFFTGYRPQFYFRTTDVTGVAQLPEGVEMVMPGDNTQVSVELITPIAMEKGLRFAIREGGRTVGSGTVTEILE